MTPAWALELPRDDIVVFSGRYAIETTARPVTEPLPRALAGLNPTHWVIADPLAFPWEQLTTRQWDAPMDVILPEEWRPEQLIGAFDRPLFSKLTSHDVLVARPWVWDILRGRYAFSRAQWRRPTGRLTNTVRQLVAGARVIDQLGDRPDLDASVARTWQLRNRYNKAMERSEMRALEPLVRSAIARQPSGAAPCVLDFTDSIGRYLPQAVRSRSIVTAFRMETAQARQVAYSYPEPHGLTIEDWTEVGIPAETMDLALVSQPEVAMRHPRALQAFESVWSSLRVGGSLIEIHRLDWRGDHDFSAQQQSLLDTTEGNAVLESFETVRNPATGRSTVAVMSYTKLGVPSRW